MAPIFNDSNDENATASSSELHWHIIESSDRWFQMHQRAVVTMQTSRSANVTRWDWQSTIGLPARLKQPAHQATLPHLVWEFPLGDVESTRMLDAIATVSLQHPRAIQMAHLLPGVSTATIMAFQEAGISIVLHDLWTLCHVMQRIERRHAQQFPDS